MSLRTILLLLVTGLWFWFCHYWQCCWIQHACYGCAEKTTISTPVFPPPEKPVKVIPNRKPLDFKWSDATAYTNEGFDAYKNGIISKLGANNILEITGHYFKEETKPDGFENMGFARAAKIRSLFSDQIDPNRIQLKSKLVDTKDEVKNDFFESATIRSLAPTLEELEDKATIRFPYNSVQKDFDPKVDEYLDKLAKRVRKTKEQVRITGHTDDRGEEGYNEKLGMRRAKEIRAILLKKGVPRSQVVVDSKGESSPLVPNDSEENMHQNRRTEIIIIK